MVMLRVQPVQYISLHHFLQEPDIIVFKTYLSSTDYSSSSIFSGGPKPTSLSLQRLCDETGELSRGSLKDRGTLVYMVEVRLLILK